MTMQKAGFRFVRRENYVPPADVRTELLLAKEELGEIIDLVSHPLLQDPRFGLVVSRPEGQRDVRWCGIGPFSAAWTDRPVPGEGPGFRAAIGPKAVLALRGRLNRIRRPYDLRVSIGEQVAVHLVADVLVADLLDTILPPYERLIPPPDVRGGTLPKRAFLEACLPFQENGRLTVQWDRREQRLLVNSRETPFLDGSGRMDCDRYAGYFEPRILASFLEKADGEQLSIRFAEGPGPSLFVCGSHHLLVTPMREPF